MSSNDFDRLGPDGHDLQNNSFEKLIDKYDQTIAELKSTLEKVIDKIDNGISLKEKDNQEISEEK